MIFSSVTKFEIKDAIFNVQYYSYQVCLFKYKNCLNATFIFNVIFKFATSSQIKYLLANIDFCYNRLILKLYRILSKNPKKPPYSKIYTRFHFLKVIFVHILKDLYNEWTRRGPKSNLIKSRTLYGRIVVKKSNNWVTILNIIRYSFKCYLIFDQNLRNFGRKIDFQHVYN